VDKLRRFIKGFIYFIKVEVTSIIGSRLLQILSSFHTKKWSKVNKPLAEVIKDVGLFSKNTSLDISNLAKQWASTFPLFNQGEFIRARNTRLGILEKIYEHHRIEDPKYFPSILSNQYFGPFGHHAVVGLHIAAQAVNILPRGRRIGIIPPKLNNDTILRLYSNDISYVNYIEGGGWTELPNNWHLAERLQILRSNEGFIEGYALTDEVFKRQTVTRENPFFSCELIYVDSCKKALQKYGFDEGDWFVGLHIRDGSPIPSLRNQKIENYLPAIKEVTDRGGWVIRIGGTDMPPMPKLPKLIDLVTEPNASKELHLFALSQAKFFIGTCSGPQYFPPLFGVPTLFTNQIGIGRSILTFSKHSIHLPKVYIRNDNSKPSFNEMLSSSFGFGELTIQEYAKRGLHVIENSPEEIKEAVIEMFLRISGSTLPRDEEFDLRINDIRSQFEWTSKGRISNSYLQANENWFIN